MATARVFLFGALLVLICAPVGWAQTARGFDFRRVTEVEDALPQSSVHVMFEDADGFLWFGTRAGLGRWDGYAMRYWTHQPGSPASLSGNVINSIAQDHRGDIWVRIIDAQAKHSSVSLNRLIAPSYTRTMSYAITPTSNEFGIGVLTDARGDVWSVTPDSLYRYVPAMDRFEAAFSKVNQATITGAFTLARDGALLLGHNTGHIERCSLTAQRCVSMPQYTPDGLPVVALYEDSTGALWVGSLEGLYRVNTTGLNATFLDLGHIQSIREANETLYVTTMTGLYTISLNTPDEARYFAPSDLVGIPDFGGRMIFEDRAGALWFATMFGLFRQDAHTKPFGQLMQSSKAPLRGIVMGLAEDAEGGIWTGTISGDLRRTHQGVTTAFRLPSRLVPSTDRFVFWDIETSGDTVWVGYNHGLSSYDLPNQQWRHYQYTSPRHIEGISPNQVHSVAIRGDSIWLAMASTGLLRFDRRLGTFSSNQLEGVSYISDVWPEVDAIWAGTIQGLYRIDRTTRQLRRFVHIPGDTTSLSNSVIHFIKRDRAGRLWVGTDGGLHLMTDEVQGHFKHWQHGLTSTTVYGSLEQPDGTFWVSTNRGLAHFDPSDAEQPFRVYHSRYGLANHEFNRQAYLAGRDGRFYFGGDQGVTVFDPTAIRDNPYLPPVVLTGIQRSQGTATEHLFAVPDDGLTLSPDHYALTFEFAALNFTNAENNRYAVQLDAGDTPWTDLGTQRRITYNSIAPGHYTFRVRATNDDGVWSPHLLEVPVVVEPPFWRTAPFVLGCMAALLACLGGAVWWRERRLHDRQAELEALVTERTERLARAKRKTEEQAERLRTLDEAKSRFFANLSHEFRTPLALILGPLDDALRGDHGPISASFHQQLHAAQRHARRLLGLIGQLLDLAKLEQGVLTLTPQPTDLVTFLSERVRSYQPLAEHRQLTLQFRPAPVALPALVDPEHLETAVANLLSNALKFTPAGGKVWVTLGTHTTETGEMVEIVVKDTGPGVPPEAVERIFERFQQADTSSTRVHGGTGIGLALARELTELHGGQLSVESEAGFGAAFTIQLPWTRPTAAPIDITQGDGAQVVLPILTEPAPSSGTQATVLIVEDNADVRQLLHTHLRDAYRLLEAEDGHAGLDLARAEQPDLILSDVMMPRLDGFALCEAIRADADLAATPIILLTARAEEADTIRGLEAGADDYLAKPYSAPELRARIAGLLASRQRLKAQASGQRHLATPAAATYSEDEAFVQQALAQIEAHLGDPQFNAGRLAEALHLSPRQLRRKLNALLGESPADLLRRLRLERAAQLLTTRTASVSEIAYEVGFKSPSHFASTFRDHFGHTPSDYAQQDML
ncbi:MAG: hybrid sensor histidine kinase/response regulator transcription factor [Rhodothermales bacterium]